MIKLLKDKNLSQTLGHLANYIGSQGWYNKPIKGSNKTGWEYWQILMKADGANDITMVPDELQEIIDILEKEYNSED